MDSETKTTTDLSTEVWNQIQQQQQGTTILRDETQPQPIPLPPPTPPSVETLVEESSCWIIRNALTIQEQINVLRDVLGRCEDDDDKKKKQPCMYPTPKTLSFGKHQRSLCFGKKQSNDDDERMESSSLFSIFDTLVLRRATSLLWNHISNMQQQQQQQHLTKTQRSFEYDRYSVSVIRYDAPNGSFPEHIDHCNNTNGWVILLSVGCTARFSVRGPSSSSGTTAATSPKKIIELKSGDVLVFDPSTDAALRHGVLSILPDSCPNTLVQSFREVDSMGTYRYGIQCRTSLVQTAGL